MDKNKIKALRKGNLPKDIWRNTLCNILEEIINETLDCRPHLCIRRLNPNVSQEMYWSIERAALLSGNDDDYKKSVNCFITLNDALVYAEDLSSWYDTRDPMYAGFYGKMCRIALDMVLNERSLIKNLIDVGVAWVNNPSKCLSLSEALEAALDGKRVQHESWCKRSYMTQVEGCFFRTEIDSNIVDDRIRITTDMLTGWIVLDK